MFTGLIETTGAVARAAREATGIRLVIATALGAELAPGDSIAVNGVCLTVASATPETLEAVLSPETLRVTTFGDVRPGALVNLERPLLARSRMGGHFVLGHVDGVGRIHALQPDGDCYWLDVDVPTALSPLMISKGSIAVDGISLTIADLRANRVRIQIVPYTFTHTSLQKSGPGDAVNLEADVIGKYVARLMQTGPHAHPAGIS